MACWAGENLNDVLTNTLRFETHDHLMGVPTGEGVGRNKDWKRYLLPVRLPRAAHDLESKRSGECNVSRRVCKGRGRGLEVKRGTLRRPGEITRSHVAAAGSVIGRLPGRYVQTSDRSTNAPTRRREGIEMGKKEALMTTNVTGKEMDEMREPLTDTGHISRPVTSRRPGEIACSQVAAAGSVIDRLPGRDIQSNERSTPTQCEERDIEDKVEALMTTNVRDKKMDGIRGTATDTGHNSRPVMSHIALRRPGEITRSQTAAAGAVILLPENDMQASERSIPTQHEDGELGGKEEALMTTNVAGKEMDGMTEPSTDTACNNRSITSDTALSAQSSYPLKVSESSSGDECGTLLHGIDVFGQLEDSQMVEMPKTSDEDSSYALTCGSDEFDDSSSEIDTEADSDAIISHFSKMEFLENIREKIAANYSVLVAEAEEKLVRAEEWVSDNKTIRMENLPLDINVRN